MQVSNLARSFCTPLGSKQQEGCAMTIPTYVRNRPKGLRHRSAGIRRWILPLAAAWVPNSTLARPGWARFLHISAGEGARHMRRVLAEAGIQTETRGAWRDRTDLRRGRGEGWGDEQRQWPPLVGSSGGATTQGDAALPGRCSLAARGYWMEVLCVMHGAAPVGHLLINGRSPTNRRSSAICPAAAEKEVKSPHGRVGGRRGHCSSRSPDGTIWCRRMVRDAAESGAGRSWGSRTWRQPDP